MVEAVIERVVAVVVGRCPAETQMPFSWKTGKKKSVQMGQCSFHLLVSGYDVLAHRGMRSGCRQLGRGKCLLFFPKEPGQVGSRQGIPVPAFLVPVISNHHLHLPRV